MTKLSLATIFSSDIQLTQKFTYHLVDVILKLCEFLILKTLVLSVHSEFKQTYIHFANLNLAERGLWIET